MNKHVLTADEMERFIWATGLNVDILKRAAAGSRKDLIRVAKRHKKGSLKW